MAQTKTPRLNSNEILALQDILRQGGYNIDDRNFPSKKQLLAFFQKFPAMKVIQEELRGYGQNLERNWKPSIHAFYTNKRNAAAEVARGGVEVALRHIKEKGEYFLADELCGALVSNTKKTFAIVKDGKDNIVDVILPGAARAGGHISFPDGNKRDFWTSPDDAMSPARRAAAKAEVLHNELPYFEKDIIRKALEATGSAYVRFFEPKGDFRYHPSDDYLANKIIQKASLVDGRIQVLEKWDAEEARKKADDPERKHQRIKIPDGMDMAALTNTNIRKGPNGSLLLNVEIKGCGRLDGRPLSPKQVRDYDMTPNKKLFETALAAKLFPEFFGGEIRSYEGRTEALKIKVNDKIADSIAEGSSRGDLHSDGLYLFRSGDRYIAYGLDAEKLSTVTGRRIYGSKEIKSSFAESKFHKLLPQLVDKFEGVAVLTEGKKPKLYGVDFTSDEYKIAHFEKNWKDKSTNGLRVPVSLPAGDIFWARRVGHQGNLIDIGVIDRNNEFRSILKSPYGIDWKKSVDMNILEAKEVVIREHPGLGFKVPENQRTGRSL